MEQLTSTFAQGAGGHSIGNASLADPPLWFILLLVLFMLVIFTVVAGGSIILAASLYRNFLRPGVKQAPLNRTWTIVAVTVLIGLVVMANVSAYAGSVALTAMLLLLVAITTWAVLWHRTKPKQKPVVKRQAAKRKRGKAASGKSKNSV